VKLTIQIKLNDVANSQELDPAPIDPRKVISFIALLILPLIFWGGYHWSGSNQDSVVANELSVTSDQHLDIPPEVVEPSNQQLLIEEPQLAPMDLAVPSPIEMQVEVVAESVEENVAAPTQAIAVTPPLEQTPDIVTEAASSTTDQLEPKQLAKTNLSDSITRITLTSGIVQREPVDDLGNRISGDAEQIVFLFNEIRDQAGQTLTHRWSLNGEEIARVNLRVGGVRWRTYSSKTITPKMVGLWQVEVLNNKGELLAVHKFDYYH